MAPLNNVKVVEVCRVSPPSGLVADTSLPLTLFDVIWLQMPPVQRLFFYQFPTTTTLFMTTLLPKLKHTLSLSLRHFYPLSGNLIESTQSGDYEICYKDGNSITLTIAESSADFHNLIANYPRHVTEFHTLIPQLLSSDAQKHPLFALQLTLFPNTGICIGTTTHHAVADGSSYMHFIKYWASLYRAGGSSQDSMVVPHPLHDRSMTKHLDGTKRRLLEQMANIRVDRILEASSVKGRADPVRATFLMSQADIETLKRWIFSPRHIYSRKPFYCSTFVLACAYVWVCLVRTRGNDDNKTVHLAFVTGCRDRLEPAIPNTYFGNCIAPRFVEAKGNDFASERGVGPAAEAIGKTIEGNAHAMEGVDSWIPKVASWEGQKVVSIAGSPKIRVYDTDFGWGKPRKVEVISIEETGAISIAEGRETGIEMEIGVALPKCEMERFTRLFDNGLKFLSMDFEDSRSVPL